MPTGDQARGEGNILKGEDSPRGRPPCRRP